MPTLKDLFGAPDDTDGGEADFDLTTMLSNVDDILKSRPSMADVANLALTADAEPVVPDSPMAESLSNEARDGETQPEPVIPPAAAVVPEPSAPLVAPDPLLELPPERRAAMLSIDQILTSDPAKRDAILRVLNEVPQPVAQVVEPQLPEEIDPSSFEAQLWRQNLDTQRAIGEMRQTLQSNQVSMEQQRSQNEAEAAGRAFAAKYVGKLDATDVVEIAKYAGQSGIAGALAASEAFRGNRQAAYEKALEDTLWTNETFRQKVMEAPAVSVPGPSADAEDRKRKLTAISSGANPVSGAPVQRAALETREDGRLTPQSRNQAVRELAGGLLRAQQGY